MYEDGRPRRPDRHGAEARYGWGQRLGLRLRPIVTPVGGTMMVVYDLDGGQADGKAKAMECCTVRKRQANGGLRRAELSPSLMVHGLGGVCA